MKEFPHRYLVDASAEPDGDVTLAGEGLESIASAPPVEFGGPGNRWSPENLLVAAVADCFVLSFRAIARASKLAWNRLDCSVEGDLDRVEGKLRFTTFTVRATLAIPEDSNADRARRILEKAEETCLVTNTLAAEVVLRADVAQG
jgi:peroxiredoxin-like protein